MNPFISVSSVQRLVRYQRSADPITSFYLNTDQRTVSVKGILTEGLSLIEQERKSREANTVPVSESIMNDLRSIQKYLEGFHPEDHIRGLVLFSSSEEGYFEAFHLSHPVRTRIVCENLPFLRPLLAILDNYRRIMLAIVDHREARFFEIFSGQIREHDSFRSPIRGKVKTGGLAGVEERRIERSIENKIVHHYKEVGETILDHFRHNRFDTLVVGMKEEDYPDFLRVLHSYPKEKLVDRVNLHPKSSQKEIIEEAQRIELEIRERENQAILERLIAMVGNDEAAVAGLPGVLRSLHLGACQALVVDEEYREPGVFCESCNTIDVKTDFCPQCQNRAIPVKDVVAEAIEEALFQNAEVRFIPSPNPQLEQIHRIGAFLRFQL